MFPVIRDSRAFSKASSTTGSCCKRRHPRGMKRQNGLSPWAQSDAQPWLSVLSAEGRGHFASPAPFWPVQCLTHLFPRNLGAMTVTIKGLRSSEEFHRLSDNMEHLSPPRHPLSSQSASAGSVLLTRCQPGLLFCPPFPLVRTLVIILPTLPYPQ